MKLWRSMAMNAIYLNPQLLALGLIFCLIQIREIEVGKIWLFYLSFGGMHYEPLAINGNECHGVGGKEDGDRW